jgi:hypothetical protein
MHQNQMKSTPCPSSIPNQVPQNNQPRRFFPVEKPAQRWLFLLSTVFSAMPIPRRTTGGAAIYGFFKRNTMVLAKLDLGIWYEF